MHQSFSTDVVAVKVLIYTQSRAKCQISQGSRFQQQQKVEAGGEGGLQIRHCWNSQISQCSSFELNRPVVVSIKPERWRRFYDALGAATSVLNAHLLSQCSVQDYSTHSPHHSDTVVCTELCKSVAVWVVQWSLAVYVSLSLSLCLCLSVTNTQTKWSRFTINTLRSLPGWYIINHRVWSHGPRLLTSRMPNKGRASVAVMLLF